jgi:predicted nucleotidyltransferase
MADDIDKIKLIIQEYIKLLEQNSISVEKLYLFGSYAQGTANEHSDIDIAIVSRDFKGDRFLDRRLIVPLRRQIDRRLEPMPFRSRDFQKSNPLALEIMENGIELR